MILTMHDKPVIVFFEEAFQLPSQPFEIIEISYLVSVDKFNAARVKIFQFRLPIQYHTRASHWLIQFSMINYKERE